MRDSVGFVWISLLGSFVAGLIAGALLDFGIVGSVLTGMAAETIVVLWLIGPFLIGPRGGDR